MTPEELKNNKELLAICTQETEEKIRAGLDPVQAKLEVMKAHGIVPDEDAAKAEAVGKMELSDEELMRVNGGSSCDLDYDCSSNFACNYDYSCYYAFKHSSKDVPGEPCLWNYECFFNHGCSHSDTADR